jgi:hypothetical protein
MTTHPTGALASFGKASLTKDPPNPLFRRTSVVSDEPSSRAPHRAPIPPSIAPALCRLFQLYSRSSIRLLEFQKCLNPGLSIQEGGVGAPGVAAEPGGRHGHASYLAQNYSLYQLCPDVPPQAFFLVEQVDVVSGTAVYMARH